MTQGAPQRGKDAASVGQKVGLFAAQQPLVLVFKTAPLGKEEQQHVVEALVLLAQRLQILEKERVLGVVEHVGATSGEGDDLGRAHDLGAHIYRPIDSHLRGGLGKLGAGRLDETPSKSLCRQARGDHDENLLRGDSFLQQLHATAHARLRLAGPRGPHDFRDTPGVGRNVNSHGSPPYATNAWAIESNSRAPPCASMTCQMW